MQLAQEYVREGAPFLGDSNFEDKDVVRAFGAKWNASHKKWEARNREDLKSLLQCGKWTPVGLLPQMCNLVLQVLDLEDKKSQAESTFRFDRRSKDSKFDEDTDYEVLPSGTVRRYARVCDKCGIVLDSRLQFGMECDCTDGILWHACKYCCEPLRMSEKVCERCSPVARV